MTAAATAVAELVIDLVVLMTDVTDPLILLGRKWLDDLALDDL
jgi:hypothetical protein